MTSRTSGANPVSVPSYAIMRRAKVATSGLPVLGPHSRPASLSAQTR